MLAGWAQNPRALRQRKKKPPNFSAAFSSRLASNNKARRALSVRSQIVMVRPLNLVNCQPANGSQ
jgi:hypothetical protein